MRRQALPSSWCLPYSSISLPGQSAIIASVILRLILGGASARLSRQ